MYPQQPYPQQFMPAVAPSGVLYKSGFVAAKIIRHHILARQGVVSSRASVFGAKLD